MVTINTETITAGQTSITCTHTFGVTPTVIFLGGND